MVDLPASTWPMKTMLTGARDLSSSVNLESLGLFICRWFFSLIFFFFGGSGLPSSFFFSSLSKKKNRGLKFRKMNNIILRYQQQGNFFNN